MRDKWICAFSFFHIIFFVFASLAAFPVIEFIKYQMNLPSLALVDVPFLIWLAILIYVATIDPWITYYVAYKRRNQFFILFTIIKLAILPILSFFTVIISMGNPITLLLYLMLLLFNIYYLVSCRQLYKISNSKNNR